MMFQGFSNETVDFMWGIRFNNEKGWFEAHKDQYKTCFYNPLRELAGTVYEAVDGRYPELGLVSKVSRIYRDARRLHGQGPYKDRLWFSMERPSEDWTGDPVFWFELAPEGYTYGLGYYYARPITMAKFRRRLDTNPKPFEKLVRAFNRQDVFTLDGVDYKRPKGDPGPLLYSWYNSRQFSLCRDENCEGDFFTPALKDRVLEGWKSLVPVYRWLLAVEADPPPEQM